MVDASDEAKFNEAKEELHQLMAKPQLANIPLLVLGNKNDLPTAVTDEEALKQLLYAQSELEPNLSCCFLSQLAMPSLLLQWNGRLAFVQVIPVLEKLVIPLFQASGMLF